MDGGGAVQEMEMELERWGRRLIGEGWKGRNGGLFLVEKEEDEGETAGDSGKQAAVKLYGGGNNYPVSEGLQTLKGTKSSPGIASRMLTST